MNKSLKRKRYELGENKVNEFLPRIFKLMDEANIIYNDEMIALLANDFHDIGFTACYSELWPIIERMKEVIQFNQSEWMAISGKDEKRYKNLTAWQKCRDVLAELDKELGT